MRNRLICALVLLLPLPALAQFATISAPQTVQTGVPFYVQVTLTCQQPSGDLPPPFNCNPGVPVTFSSSDSSGTVPNGSFYVVPNQPLVVSSPFVLRDLGAQNIIAFTSQNISGVPKPIANVVVQVQALVSPAPALHWLAILLLIVCIILSAAPNYSLKRTAAGRLR